MDQINSVILTVFPYLSLLSLRYDIIDSKVHFKYNCPGWCGHLLAGLCGIGLFPTLCSFVNYHFIISLRFKILQTAFYYLPD